MRTPTLYILAAAAIFVQSPAFAARHLQFLNTDVTIVTAVGPKGDSPGDIMTFAGVYTDLDGKKQLAREQGFCINVVTATKAWECSFTVILPDGMLSVQGQYIDFGDSHMVVTAGTGAYLGAKGTLLVHLQGTTPETDIMTFDLD